MAIVCTIDDMRLVPKLEIKAVRYNQKFGRRSVSIKTSLSSKSHRKKDMLERRARLYLGIALYNLKQNAKGRSLSLHLFGKLVS